MYVEKVTQYVKDHRNLDTTISSLYNVVRGQYSRLMRNKLMTMSDYEAIENENDLSKLLT